MNQPGPIAKLIMMGIYDGFRVKFKNPPEYIRRAIPASITFKQHNEYKHAVLMTYIDRKQEPSLYVNATISINLLDQYFKIDTETGA